jgi:hypothetical protein
MDALVHLSRMPALTHLTFKQCNTIPDEISPSSSPLVFSSLSHLDLCQSGSLVFISRLLAHIQLPALTGLAVDTGDCPPGCIKSFLEAVQTACIAHAMTSLEFSQYGDSTSGDPILSFDDLRPMMAFRNLHVININVFWSVGLTDDELLALASAWLYLEHARSPCPRHRYVGLYPSTPESPTRLPRIGLGASHIPSQSRRLRDRSRVCLGYGHFPRWYSPIRKLTHVLLEI